MADEPGDQDIDRDDVAPVERDPLRSRALLLILVAISLSVWPFGIANATPTCDPMDGGIRIVLQEADAVTIFITGSAEAGPAGGGQLVSVSPPFEGKCPADIPVPPEGLTVVVEAVDGGEVTIDESGVIGSATGVTFDVSASGPDDGLHVIASLSGDNIAVNASGLLVDEEPISMKAIERLSIDGGAGDDVIRADAEGDPAGPFLGGLSLLGGGGNDLIVGAGDTTSIDGGDGTDTCTFPQPPAANCELPSASPSPAHPDLAVAISQASVVDGMLNLHVTVSNSGDLDQGSTLSIELNGLDTGSARNVPAIEPGQSVDVPISAPLPDSTIGTKVTVTVSATLNGSVEDINTSNNSASRSVEVPAGGSTSDGSSTDGSTLTSTPGSHGGSSAALPWTIALLGGVALVGTAAAIRYFPPFDHLTLEEKAEDKCPDSGCENGTRCARFGDRELEPSRRSLTHIVVEERDRSGGNEIKVDDGIAQLNEALGDCRRGANRDAVKQMVAPPAELIANTVVDRFGERLTSGVSVVAHGEGTKGSQQFVLCKCRDGQWTEGRKWKAKLQDRFQRPVVSLGPIHGVADRKRFAEELAEGLTRVIVDIAALPALIERSGGQE